MSQGPRHPLELARRVADELHHDLEPVVQRIVIAGSVRRERPEVGDIDLVLVPPFLLGSTKPYLADIKRRIARWGPIQRGGERLIVVGDVLGNPGLNVDVNMVHPPASWGTILALRTGPTVLSLTAKHRLRERGLDHQRGRVIDVQTGEEIPTPEEADFFSAAGLPYTEPNRRHLPEAVVPSKQKS